MGECPGIAKTRGKCLGGMSYTRWSMDWCTLLVKKDWKFSGCICSANEDFEVCWSRGFQDIDWQGEGWQLVNLLPVSQYDEGVKKWYLSMTSTTSLHLHHPAPWEDIVWNCISHRQLDKSASPASHRDMEQAAKSCCHVDFGQQV